MKWKIIKLNQHHATEKLTLFFLTNFDMMSCNTPDTVVKIWDGKQKASTSRNLGIIRPLRNPLFSICPVLAFKDFLQTSDLSISEKHIQGKELLNHNFLLIHTSLADSGEDWLSLWVGGHRQASLSPDHWLFPSSGAMVC